MNRTLRITGLILASLTISTVAMAQQGGGNGGGRGGDGSGNGGSGGDPSVLEVLRDDAKQARLTRAVEPRRGNRDCLTHVCEQPPETRYPPRDRIAQFDASCAGGEILITRGRNGQAVRYLCRNL